MKNAIRRRSKQLKQQGLRDIYGMALLSIGGFEIGQPGASGGHQALEFFQFRINKDCDFSSDYRRCRRIIRRTGHYIAP